MRTSTHRKVHRMIEAGAALVLIGIGLNALITQTLGALDAASVLLILYLALLAYGVGSIVLLALSIWVFMTRNSLGSTVITTHFM